MKFASRDEIMSRTLAELRFSEPNVVPDHELVVALLLRGLWLWAPCTRAMATTNTLRALRVFNQRQIEREIIEFALDELITSGHIVELQSRVLYDGRLMSTLFVKPPCYITLESGALAISGFGRGSREQLPEKLLTSGILSNSLILVSSSDAPKILDDLEASGIKETRANLWINQPEFIEAQTRIDNISLKAAARPVSQIEDLRLIDPASDVMYYSGRWTTQPTDDMRTIGRRPQSYGADLWCFVDYSGKQFKFVDLPSTAELTEGRDEGWISQLAIDFINDNRQKLRVSEPNRDILRLDFFSPIPGWVERRWALYGKKSRPHGVLFSYEFEVKIGWGEVEFAEREMYLEIL